MAPINQSVVTMFFLQNFVDDPWIQNVLFCFFFALFVAAIAGNGLIITVIHSSANLHTPMYFFLVNLSLMDVICTVTVLPKVLQSLVAENAISYGGCLTQMFVFSWVLGSELLLFSAMAYDRYLAICRPLHYGTLMSGRVCIALATFVWFTGALNSLVLTCLVLPLSFCGPNLITHFFCEIPSVLMLSCSPTFINDIMTVIADMFLTGLNFLLTMTSYGFIIASILRIRSAEGKKRAFSTCSAHLVVVTLYYSTVLYTYVRPALGTSGLLDKVIAVLYTTVTPSLNPLIYTLRNKEFKTSFKKLLFPN
ncbi:olfactory receptor Olr300 [Rattus norvegicus]|uniref:Olfactory receptor family 12 subfamily J member 4 n=1 Tax=Rattus norvegicus TaxID=10116 RepID=A0A8I6B0Y0_RAT|nr:olfactory receptor Olr300 [Rattus norvegicus]|eukprot:NP_001000237.1 olfactory receptor Olr300 [Rattus norvegicus]